MEKINPHNKLKLLLIFLLTNSFSYLLALPSQEVRAPLYEEETVLKKDYIELQISAQLYAKFKKNKPITILDANNSILIQYALLREIEESEQEQFTVDKTSGTKFIVYLHEKFLPKILKSRELKLIPYTKYETQTSKKDGKIEITI